MRLSKSDVDARIGSLDGWKRDGDEIERKFKFADFAQAMAFVNAVAGDAEDMDHHPDIKISYNKVKMTLSTHSEGGITDKDFVLAEKIDVAAGSFAASPDAAAQPAAEPADTSSE